MPSIQAKMISGLFKLIGVNKMLLYGLQERGNTQASRAVFFWRRIYLAAGFPEIDIFYGTREVMIAYLKDFQDVCRRYGVKLNTHIGKDMMHCWGAMEFVPEARAVRQEYFKALQ